MLWQNLWLIMVGFGCATETKTEDSGINDQIEVPTYCETLGLTNKPFDASGVAGDFGEIAPDFTFNLLDGETWTLSEYWTGCDNYIFLNYFSANEYPARLTRPREIQEMLELMPVNTHLFVLAYPGQGESLEGLMGDLDSNFEAAYGMLENEAEMDWWREKVHFVLDDGWSADWIGMLNNDYYEQDTFVMWSAAIDRNQHVREVGNYCDPSTGWEQCPPFFMAYESIYFNFESEREAELAEHNADIVPIFEQELIADPNWAGVKTIAEVTLPTAEEMLAYDTLHLDLNLECVGYPARTQCPAWDYIVNLYLCDEDDPSTDEDESEVCTTEFGRWITTYWRPGRWVHDATPMMAWLNTGGTRKFAFYSQQPYNVSVDLRFSNQDKGMRPIAMEEVYRGGGLDDFYNWGAYHSISETEWRQWTIEEQQDVYTVVSQEVVSETKLVVISEATIELHEFVTLTEEEVNAGASPIQTFSIVETAQQDEAVITIGDPSNVLGPDLMQRMVFTWTEDSEEPLALCIAEVNAVSVDDAIDSVQHCTVDDPTMCSLRADPTDLVSGCNFGAWTMLSSEEYDPSNPILEGAWISHREQQFVLLDNGSENGRYANKSSRVDWVLGEDTLFFCQTEPTLSSSEDGRGFLERCTADNGNTDTVDESLNCVSKADPVNLDQGCNGSAWRQMDRSTSIGSETWVGEYQEVWHEDKLPIEFTPPEGTTKVEIAGVISGHGFGADTFNCAEFCDHQHQFQVNDGTPIIKTHPEAGSPLGCADQVAIGTVPNQSGTWVYGRAGWCPGMEVPVWRVDFTADVDVSGSNTLEYIGLVRGEIYYPSYTSGTFRPRVDMRSYLVYYQ